MADLLAIQRIANEARSLYEDPAFRRVYEKLYLAAFNQFRRSLPEEHAKRDEAFWRLNTLEALDAELVGEIKAPQLEGKRQDRRNDREE